MNNNWINRKNLYCLGTARIFKNLIIVLVRTNIAKMARIFRDSVRFRTPITTIKLTNRLKNTIKWFLLITNSCQIWSHPFLNNIVAFSHHWLKQIIAVTIYSQRLCPFWLVFILFWGQFPNLNSGHASIFSSFTFNNVSKTN